MHVYRIETEQGGGVCHASNLCKKYHTVCKTPCLDFGFHDEFEVWEKMVDGWRFAFPSLERLKEWFPDQHGREVMKSNRAVVVEYDVANFIEGVKDTQVLFDFHKAKKVGEFDVVTFAPL